MRDMALSAHTAACMRWCLLCLNEPALQQLMPWLAGAGLCVGIFSGPVCRMLRCLKLLPRGLGAKRQLSGSVPGRIGKPGSGKDV